MVLDMDRKVFIFTRARRSPFQGAFRWSFPRPEGLGCSVKPLRGKSGTLSLGYPRSIAFEPYCAIGVNLSAVGGGIDSKTGNA